MPGVVVLESMWNKKGRLLDDEPSVLPYLKAIKQSLAWEGIRVNLVYRRFYSSYDLGLLLEEVRRRRRSFQVCYIASHGQRRKLVGIGDKVIRLETLVDHCRPSTGTGYIFGACDFVTPDTAKNFLLATGARFVAGSASAFGDAASEPDIDERVEKLVDRPVADVRRATHQASMHLRARRVTTIRAQEREHGDALAPCGHDRS